MTPEGMEPNGSVKQRAALWIGVVFVLAFSLGGVSGYVFALQSHADTKPVLSDDVRRAQKVEQLTKELSLTPDQQKKLDDSLRDTYAKFKTIREAMQPQVDTARYAGRDRVRSFLTPEQLPKYEAYLKRIDEERKREGKM